MADFGAAMLFAKLWELLTGGRQRARAEDRDRLDRVAAYVGAAATVIDRIRLEKTPELSGSCEELASLLKGLAEEPAFAEVLSPFELDMLDELLTLADFIPGRRRHLFASLSPKDDLSLTRIFNSSF